MLDVGAKVQVLTNGGWVNGIIVGTVASRNTSADYLVEAYLPGGIVTELFHSKLVEVELVYASDTDTDPVKKIY